MKIKIVAVGDNKEKWLSLFLDEYQKKISQMCQFELKFLKPYKGVRGDAAIKKKKETEALIAQVKDSPSVFLLDERGETYDSIQFSELLTKQYEHSGSATLTLVIGGAYGVTSDLHQYCQKTISFSKMVMNHHVALAVLTEQVYRALMIKNGKSYHNQ